MYTAFILKSCFSQLWFTLGRGVTESSLQCWLISLAAGSKRTVLKTAGWSWMRNKLRRKTETCVQNVTSMYVQLENTCSHTSLRSECYFALVPKGKQKKLPLFIFFPWNHSHEHLACFEVQQQVQSSSTRIFCSDCWLIKHKVYTALFLGFLRHDVYIACLAFLFSHVWDGCIS